MKLSQINFNLHGSNLSLQKVFSNQIPRKINFQKRNQDTFIKSDSFSNEDALKLLRTELQKCMTSEEAEDYMKKIKNICSRLGIEPKKLPINKNHPGGLEDYQWQQIAFLVKEDAISVK